MTDLDSILATGLNWLYDTVQPDDAHTTHHGLILGLPEANRRYGFCPSGYGSPTVVIVDVAKVEWIDNGPNQLPTPGNPIEPGELDALAEELNRRGHKVAGSWNGHPGITGSVGLARVAHPSLAAAVDRYRRGCTVHPERRVFCDCATWRAGFSRTVRPALPMTPAARSV
ncbi:hypothetical protein AB0N99_30595 [Streptomyces sp. NPDC093272]|uniref:hypothetical protein n=1 Tax=Streptomyces sp. NPDC093272 TaxID=3154981 RepID=UPI00342E7C89